MLLACLQLGQRPSAPPPPAAASECGPEPAVLLPGLEGYDDQGAGPRRMLATAATLLGELQTRLRSAATRTSAAWSVISHISVRKTVPAAPGTQVTGGAP